MIIKTKNQKLFRYLKEGKALIMKFHEKLRKRKSQFLNR
jgi:hypothetical protein